VITREKLEIVLQELSLRWNTRDFILSDQLYIAHYPSASLSYIIDMDIVVHRRSSIPVSERYHEVQLSSWEIKFHSMDRRHLVAQEDPIKTHTLDLLECWEELWGDD
jgi:hypothetical protein